MPAQLFRIFVAVLIPVGLLLATHGLRLNLARLPTALTEIVPTLPYLLLAAALALALLFSRGRAVIVLLQLAGLYWILGHPLDWQLHGAYLDADTFRLGVAFLLPLNVAIIAGLRERGVLTRHGVLRLTAVACQVGVLLVFAMSRPHLLRGLLEATPFAMAVPYGSALLTQPVLLAFAVAGGVLLVRFALTRSPFIISLIGILAAVLMVLHHAGDQQTAALFTAAAGLLLFIALLQDSYRMAYRDDLTGLPGRRALQEELLKLGSRYTIAMLDVDHFKRFNDRHGHDVGDQVLKLVAARMQQVRGGGKAFRYGGEEFTVLFSGKRAEQALPHLEALREAIADSAFQLRGKDRPKEQVQKRKAGSAVRKRPAKRNTVSVTVSIGVAERDERQPTPHEVMKKADQALYKAKEGGRNRVCG